MSGKRRLLCLLGAHKAKAEGWTACRYCGRPMLSTGFGWIMLVKRRDEKQ